MDVRSHLRFTIQEQCFWTLILPGYVLLFHDMDRSFGVRRSAPAPYPMSLLLLWREH